MPAPMPGLIVDPQGIAARVTEDEAEPRGVVPQPGESGRAFKRCFGGRFTWAADVQRTAAVVFGKSGGRIDAQDVVQCLTTLQFASEDSGLVRIAAKPRNGIQRNA